MQKDSSTCSVRVSDCACVQLGMCCGMQIVAVFTSIKRTHLVSVLFPLSHVATTPRRATSAAHAPARRSAILIAMPFGRALDATGYESQVCGACEHADFVSCEKLGGVTLGRERSLHCAVPARWLIARLSLRGYACKVAQARHNDGCRCASLGHCGKSVAGRW
jgi:hypothetical protein